MKKGGNPMKKFVSGRLIHALTALMLSAGTVMPVLGVLDTSFPELKMIAISAMVVLVFEILMLHRAAIVSGIAVFFAGAALWGFSPAGSRIMSDLTIALSLRFRGIDTALPLIGSQAKIIITCLITLLCCAACVRKATYLPAIILSVAAALLIWISNRTELIPWLLPGLTATVTLMMASGYQDTSFFRVIPWAAAIVCSAFLLSGSGATIPSLKNKADELRRSVMDRFFFTEARDVFSLYTVGFSPQGPDQLGGRPTPGNDAVMSVSAPKNVYLRGAIYDEYTGHSWVNTSGGRRFLWQSGRTEQERSDIFDQKLPATPVQDTLSQEYSVTVSMLENSTSTLFVPQRIRELNPETNMVPYFSNSSEVFITRNLKKGDIYTVTGPLYTSDDPGIGNVIEICSRASYPESSARIPEKYYSLPDHLDPSLYSMAADITKGSDSSFERAYMIQQYLKNTYDYSLEVDDQPAEYDFVTTFLTKTRKGYCTYFASAMTVLCRMNALPARYVEGYLARPGTEGNVTVTGEDAHAWTEVYFDGFGWLTFDATPGSLQDPDSINGTESEPSSTGSQQDTGISRKSGPESPSESTAPSGATPEPEPTPGPEPSDTPTSSPPSQKPEKTPTPPPDISSEYPHHQPDQFSQKQKQIMESDDNTGSEPGARFPWILIPILILLLLCLRIVFTSPAVRARLSGNEEQAAAVWHREITDLLAGEHIFRKKGETLISFADRVDRTGYFSASLHPVGETLSAVIYSSADCSPEDTILIRDTAVVLRSEISKPAKARYWIHRIFIPLSQQKA